MPTKKDLEQLRLTKLAAMCMKVADNAFKYSVAGAEEALKLHLEWGSLTASTPPSAKALKEIQAKKQALKKRMAEFLADIL